LRIVDPVATIESTTPARVIGGPTDLIL
jgi:hypothetical protein